jgi:CheY-like chemotaxis protein
MLLRWSGLLQPVLAVTASILKPDQEMCMRTGYQGVISKPIAVKAIASQVPDTPPPSLSLRTSPFLYAMA